MIYLSRLHNQPSSLYPTLLFLLLLLLVVYGAHSPIVGGGRNIRFGGRGRSVGLLRSRQAGENNGGTLGASLCQPLGGELLYARRYASQHGNTAENVLTLHRGTSYIYIFVPANKGPSSVDTIFRRK